MSLATLKNAVQAALENAHACAGLLLAQLKHDVDTYAQSTAKLLTLKDNLDDAFDDLDDAIAAVVYPTVTPTEEDDEYDILLPQINRDGAVVTAEDVEGDEDLAQELLDEGNGMLRIHEPTAEFIVDDVTASEAQELEFTNQTTNGGADVTYLWNFGDGNTSTDTDPTHSYETTGTKTVTLTATNAGGSNTKTRTNYITVS